MNLCRIACLALFGIFSTNCAARSFLDTNKTEPLSDTNQDVQIDPKFEVEFMTTAPLHHFASLSSSGVVVQTAFAGRDFKIRSNRSAVTLGCENGIVKNGYLEWRADDTAWAKQDAVVNPFSSDIKEFTIRIPSSAKRFFEYRMIFAVQNSNGNTTTCRDDNSGKNYFAAIVHQPDVELSFPADLSTHTSSGSFKPNGTLRISYNTARAKALGVECESRNGIPLCPTVKGFAKFSAQDGQEILSYNWPTTISKYQYIPIPEKAERLEIWFQIVSYSGKEAWDSDYGKNFVFMVQPH